MVRMQGGTRIGHHLMPFAPFAYTGMAIIGLFLLVILYGYYFGRFQLRVHNTTYASFRVPAAFDGYKIHLIEKHGFSRCGIIYTRDHSPRVAISNFYTLLRIEYIDQSLSLLSNIQFS